jgi:hypothetical protein
MSIEIILTKSAKMISHTARIVGIPEVKNGTGSGGRLFGDPQLLISVAQAIVYFAGGLSVALIGTVIFPRWMFAGLVFGALVLAAIYYMSSRKR